MRRKDSISILQNTNPESERYRISRKDKIYFPSLNGLRAIAAFVVLFTHVERYRQVAGKPSVTGIPLTSFLGGLAVTFFFVLSGFLITWLLIREKEDSGTIDLRGFLRKRVFRIWPLYYTILAAGYLISIFILKDTSTDPLQNGLVLNLLLLPNLAFALSRIPDILIQIWSVGTEEQFYFLWPFLIKKIPVKKLPRLFLGIILAWVLIRVLIRLLPGNQYVPDAFFFRTRIDCMAFGGLAACLILHQGSGKDICDTLYGKILHPVSGLVMAGVFAGLLWISWRYNTSIYQCYSLLFAVFIIRSINRPVRLLEWGPVKYAGKISFGIYLMHQFWVYFVYRCFPVFGGKLFESPFGAIKVFLLVSALTLVSASLSYEFFESRFLKKARSVKGNAGE